MQEEAPREEGSLQRQWWVVVGGWWHWCTGGRSGRGSVLTDVGRYVRKTLEVRHEGRHRPVKGIVA
jgi:hypothetical protein